MLELPRTTSVAHQGESAPFGEYVVYVDESGDHALDRMDSQYPVFVLAFCIFEKASYARFVCPALQELKFKYFGQDTVILHERDIRKATGHFSILQRADLRRAFMENVNQLIVDLPMTLVAVVIRKDALKYRYSIPDNPYNIALEYGMERVCRYLDTRGQRGKRTHFIFECRGAKEDQELELTFLRVAAMNSECRHQELMIIMCPKSGNAAGMQVADLMARPIGRYVMAPEQPNRAYDLIKPKFRKGGLGYGLKIFP